MNGFETLNTFSFHIEKYITKKLENVSIKIQFYYESKYNAQAIHNIHFYMSKQKIIS
jgi:hypothetical protein